MYSNTFYVCRKGCKLEQARSCKTCFKGKFKTCNGAKNDAKLECWKCVFRKGVRCEI